MKFSQSCTGFYVSKLALSLAVAATLSLATPADAGVFDLASYVGPNKWAVGFEPEVVISKESGAGFNFKPRYGVNDNLSWQGLIGLGAGARNFRIGVLGNLEWFPDIKDQPGIATAGFMEYYRVREDGLFTFGVKPMIYKTFLTESADYTPFVSVPLGWSLRNSDFNGTVQVALGTLVKMKQWKQWVFTGEAGFNGINSYSYISGGVTYLH